MVQIREDRRILPSLHSVEAIASHIGTAPAPIMAAAYLLFHTFVLLAAGSISEAIAVRWSSLPEHIAVNQAGSPGGMLLSKHGIWETGNKRFSCPKALTHSDNSLGAL